MTFKIGDTLVATYEQNGQGFCWFASPSETTFKGEFLIIGKYINLNGDLPIILLDERFPEGWEITPDSCVKYQINSQYIGKYARVPSTSVIVNIHPSIIIQSRGMNCCNPYCKIYFEGVEANVPNGFMCYGCRTNHLTRTIHGG